MLLDSDSVVRLVAAPLHDPASAHLMTDAGDVKSDAASETKAEDVAALSKLVAEFETDLDEHTVEESVILSDHFQAQVR